MPGFALPTFSETRDFAIAVGRALFPDRNYGNSRTYHARRAGFMSAAVTQIIASLKTAMDDLMPDTASDNGPIDRWGNIIKVKRKGATASHQVQAGRVRGTVGTPVDAGQQLVHPSSGLLFQIANGTTIGAAGYADADIESVSLGSATQLTAGQVLNFIATPSGLATGVTLVKDLNLDGEDAEQYGAYQQRVLNAFGQPAAGGNQDDYVKWMLETPGIGVATAYAYPNRAGLGTVDLVPLYSGSGAARIMSSPDAAAVLAYVATKAPASVVGNLATPVALRTLTVIPDAQAVEIVLYPLNQTSFAFDWVGGPLTVLTWNATTRAMQFSTPLPASMKAGHRLSLKGIATAQDGAQLTIEAIAASDTVIIQTAPNTDPAATDVAYSGGPLVQPIRDALLGHINGETVYAGAGGVPIKASAASSTVGLQVLATGLGPANPAGVFGPWIGGLYVSTIGKIALYQKGVRSYAIITPSGDYEALNDGFPNDAQIHMVTPSNILVRGAT